MLDHGHVDFSEKVITFNVGGLIKQSAYNKLVVTIRKGNNTAARLGVHRTNGTAHIVIETDKLPARDKIDSFLEDAGRAKSFMAAFSKYLNTMHADDPDAIKHADELQAEINAPGKVEEIYDEIVKSVDEAIEAYKKEHDSAHEVFGRFNITKQETQKATLGLVRSERFGNGPDEFAKKFFGASSHAAHLNKEGKEKILSRLKSMYISKIHPMLSQ